MSRHWSRSQYYLVSKGEVVEEPEFMSGVSPHASVEPPGNAPPRARGKQPIGKFDMMFGLETAMAKNDPETRAKLIELGQKMNEATNPPKPQAGESTLPAGYTYLGQFIAHEISFDKTTSPLEEAEPLPGNFRSPQIDLDSLYGLGPEKEPRLYQDDARLKIGETIGEGEITRTFLNDLPRVGYSTNLRRKPAEAVIADPRNDDNLATAQMHVALARFHNKVVDTLQAGEGFRKACPDHPKGCPRENFQLFKCARKQVVQHFQAIILTDFLPRILDNKGMECVKSGELRYYTVDNKEDLYMPLEFSAAAFRFGHSMVRGSYEWNHLQCSEEDRNGRAQLNELFQFTHFSGNLGLSSRLRSDWIIDWRRFFDFEVLGYPADERKKNRARRIDTAFNLHLDKINGHPHSGFGQGERSITVRNLLRGYSFQLPTGEQVAKYVGVEGLTPAEVVEGPHKDLLTDPLLRGKTPLWYYVLREAEVNNRGKNPGKLGPVGSCIVAETLVALIKKSEISIFNKPDWRPRFGNRANKDTEFKRYEMVDLLDFADVVDPVGEFMTRH